MRILDLLQTPLAATKADCGRDPQERSDFVKFVSTGQADQAQNIARRLHMSEGRISLPQIGLSTADPGSAQPSPDDLARMDNSTPLLVYKSIGSIQEVLNGSLELNRGRSRNFILFTLFK